MSEWFVEAANHTCGRFPPEVDEMAVSGLTPAKSTVVAPPRVKESAVNMECKVSAVLGNTDALRSCHFFLVIGK